MTTNVNQLVELCAKLGASEAFLKCLETDIDGRHIAREVAQKAKRHGGKPLMGGFTTSLWDGDVRYSHADTQSRKLLRESGVISAYTVAQYGDSA